MKITTSSLSPKQIREMNDLKQLGNPKNPPEWITPELVSDCMIDSRIQQNWHPRTGDWYYCSKLEVVRQIVEPSIRCLISQHSSLEDSIQLGCIFDGGCDIYLPNPERLKIIRNRYLGKNL